MPKENGMPDYRPIDSPADPDQKLLPSQEGGLFRSREIFEIHWKVRISQYYMARRLLESDLNFEVH